MRQDEHPSPVVVRLKALMTAGYRIREQDFGDADNYISLEHPANWQKVKEKSLFLYDEGSVMGGPRVDDTCLLIEPNDAVEFQRLVAATPKPTWWERNCGPFYTAFAWIIIGALVLTGVAVIDIAWDALFGSNWPSIAVDKVAVDQESHAKEPKIA